MQKNKKTIGTSSEEKCDKMMKNYGIIRMKAMIVKSKKKDG